MSVLSHCGGVWVWIWTEWTGQDIVGNRSHMDGSLSRGFMREKLLHCTNS